MRKILDRFTAISTADPDDARKRKILNIFLVSVGAAAVLSMFAAVVLLLTSQQNLEDVSLIFWGSALTILGFLVIYAINAFWSGRIAASIFLTFLSIVFVFSDSAQQVSSGRSLFLFTLPIIMASILLTPASSFIFAALSSAIVAYIAVSISFVPNVPAMIGFFLVAMVSWLSARSLERALKELREINADLDKVVIERTQALAESLTRERIVAGRNQAILNSIADGVIVFDRDWNAMLANPAVRNMLELPTEQVVGNNFREIIERPGLSSQSRGLMYAMMEHETQPPSFRIEWHGKTLLVNAAQVYDTRDEVNVNIGTVAVFRDFTREAEVERLKSTFVGIVSHELRTPLSAILGYSEMFKEAVYGPMNDKQVNVADRIMKNTRRLLGLINDLLDQAQMEAGRLTIKMGPVKPAELLDAIHGLLDKSATDKNLRLTSELDPHLPEFLNGDSERLQQILVNLVNNSIKFTSEGTIRVRLYRENANRWGIAVSDTGTGIPEAEIPHIFDTFRQVDGAATRVHGGFGLGLSIVKQLVTLMNGEIHVESRMGGGTTFILTLPLVIPENMAAKRS